MTSELPPTSAQPQPGAAAPTQPHPGESDKLFVVTWLFALLLGFFGVDHFYLGKVGTGILKLISIGGFGIWWLIDLILTLAGARRDNQGRPLAGYEQNKQIAWVVTAIVVGLWVIGSAISGFAGTWQVGMGWQDWRDMPMWRN